MGLNQRAIEQIELELAVAKGNATALQIDPEVSKDAKIVASAIVQAGTQIALAIAAQDV